MTVPVQSHFVRSVLIAVALVFAFFGYLIAPTQSFAKEAAGHAVTADASTGAQAEGHGEHGADATAEGAGHEEEHGLPTFAPIVFHIGPIPITSSTILTWAVTLGLVLFVRIATRHMQTVPTGAQNFVEWIVESLRTFLEGIIGRHLVDKTFWFFATIFIFILATNWFSLIPGVGTVGWGHATGPWSLGHVSTPILRGVNADLNMTFAMSTVFFALWIFWAVQVNGVGGVIKHIFGSKGNLKGFMGVVIAIVFVAVGGLEIVTILFRPVTLSFRLFGNIFAGENMLETMSMMGGWAFGWLLALPFYFMELLVGLVQALVFMLLTAVFTLLICEHHEEGHAEGHGEEGHASHH